MNGIWVTWPIEKISALTQVSSASPHIAHSTSLHMDNVIHAMWCGMSNTKQSRRNLRECRDSPSIESGVRPSASTTLLPGAAPCGEGTDWVTWQLCATMFLQLLTAPNCVTYYYSMATSVIQPISDCILSLRSYSDRDNVAMFTAIQLKS